MPERDRSITAERVPPVNEASEALQNEVRRTIATGLSRTMKSITGVSCHIMNQYKKMKNNNAIARVTGDSTERTRLAVKKEGRD